MTNLGSVTIRAKLNRAVHAFVSVFDLPVLCS